MGVGQSSPIQGYLGPPPLIEETEHLLPSLKLETWHQFRTLLGVPNPCFIWFCTCPNFFWWFEICKKWGKVTPDYGTQWTDPWRQMGQPHKVPPPPRWRTLPSRLRHVFSIVPQQNKLFLRATLLPSIGPLCNLGQYQCMCEDKRTKGWNTQSNTCSLS